MKAEKPTPGEEAIIDGLRSIFRLLDERLPKEEPAWVRDGIIPTLQGSARAKDADPIDDATNARYEREDAEARQDDPDDSDAFYWMKRAEKEKARAEQAERRVDELEPALARSETERDEWKAKHAALRAAVEACRNACQIEDILSRDDARDPQPDLDTVTLRRDDAETLLRFWEIAGGNGVVRDTARRVRVALGWGGRDDA